MIEAVNLGGNTSSLGDDVEVDPGSKEEEVDEAANKQDGDKEEDAAAAAAAAMMLRLFEDMLGTLMQ